MTGEERQLQGKRIKLFDEINNTRTLLNRTKSEVDLHREDTSICHLPYDIRGRLRMKFKMAIDEEIFQLDLEQLEI